MTEFKIFDQNNAPEKSRPILEKSLKTRGMIANLHGVMAGAPGLLEGYQKLHQLATETSFSKEELTVVWQTLNVEHNCHYCVPAHTAIANGMKVDAAITEALRNETPLPTDKLEVLRAFTLDLTRSRGLVSEEAVSTFLEAGFSQQNILEIILVLAQKVMSNYTNHLAQTPLDKPFQKSAWEKEAVHA
jgi:alkylhydroperoxidase family enzyme